MIDDDDVLNAYLGLLRSNKLWSEFGIRSLSIEDEYFGRVHYKFETAVG